MSEPEATPGPWKAERRDWKGEESPHRIYVSGNEQVCWDEDGDDEAGQESTVSTAIAIVEGNATSHGTTEANARLIAACPCLLAACRSMVKVIEACEGLLYGDPDKDELIARFLVGGKAKEIVQAAIAKATGSDR